MGKARYIQTKYWEDSFIVELEPLEKFLFLYLITNPLVDICGGYEISIRKMVYDTGVDKNSVSHILVKFEKAEKVFYNDGWIFIKNFIKHQNWKSDKIVKGIIRSLENCPSWIKDKVFMEYQTIFIEYGYGIEGYKYGFNNSNPNPNLNLNSNPLPLNPPKVENGNGVSKKNGMGRVGESKFSEEERRKYAESQTEINDVDAYVNSIRSRRGDFDKRVQKWMAENCSNCRAYNSDRHSGCPSVPPCLKHGDESFDDWKNRFIARKKGECRDCRSYSDCPDESPKCEKHGDEEKLNRNFQSFITENLKIRGLDSADYFSTVNFSRLAVGKPEFELSLP